MTEYYSEETHSVTVTLNGRIEDIRYTCRRGSAHRTVDKNGVSRQKFSEGCATAEKPPAALFDSASRLLTSARTAFLSVESAKPFLTATLTCRWYDVGPDSQTLKRGYEEGAEIDTEWLAPSAKKTSQWSRSRASIVGLVQEVEGENGLAMAVRASLSPAAKWPAPAGRIPVLWSARAVAKLQMLFLRAFEGDRVIQNHSFLTDALPAMAFTLEDRPPQTGEAVDHEGQLRKKITLLREGKPTALACNRDIAEMLDVPSTGHARRQSFECTSTVGFWHPHIEGKLRGEHLLARMDHGIRVADFETLYFNPMSGETTLRLNAFLIHHGAQGEPLEPVTLDLPLPELLASLEEFDAQPITTGFAVAKQSQRLFIEMTTGQALSRPLPIPGSVPLNHYW